MPVNMGTPRELGRKAFESGLDDSPGNYPAMRQLLNTLGPLERIDARGEYQSSWVQAALAAPEHDYNDEPGPDWRTCWHGWPKGECPSCYPDPVERGGSREDIGR